MRNIQNKTMRKRFEETLKRLPAAMKKGVRLFSLSVGAAAVCALTSLGVMQAVGVAAPDAVEASAFNAWEGVPAAATASAQVTPAKKVIPVGDVFGIKLFTDGVIVASLSDIYADGRAVCPAAESGIRPGDYLLKANGVALWHNADASRVIGGSGGAPVALTVRRGETVFEAEVAPVYTDGAFKTGMWIRDSAAGIGTITFCDPDTGDFAALGHGICDMDTRGVMSLRSGEPAAITLCGVTRGEKSAPGQLRGYFSSDEAMGTLYRNDETGVYGRLSEAPSGEAVEVLSRAEVHTGKVQLLVTLDDTGPHAYDAEIEKLLDRDQATRNFVVHVTDPDLLERTGGIVQGMSGCPILEDGKLAGAVTHVFTEDASRGYGIFAETMWEESADARVSK